jgi:hypothetical protein
MSLTEQKRHNKCNSSGRSTVAAANASDFHQTIGRGVVDLEIISVNHPALREPKVSD